MEGSCARTFPRTLLDKPVELELGGRRIRIEHAANNVSVGGLFVRHSDLPVGAKVRVRIVGRRVFEAEGHIRDRKPRGAGAGIRFAPLSRLEREALDDLIEDLTLRGLPTA
jgi:hypothetical protein